MHPTLAIPAPEAPGEKVYEYEIRWRQLRGELMCVRVSGATFSGLAERAEKMATMHGWRPRRWWQLWRTNEWRGYVPTSQVREVFKHAFERLRSKGWLPLGHGFDRSRTLIGAIEVLHGVPHPVTHAAMLCFHDHVGDAVVTWELDANDSVEVLDVLAELAGLDRE